MTNVMFFEDHFSFEKKTRPLLQLNLTGENFINHKNKYFIDQ